MSGTTFVGKHEVGSDGICVWCNRAVERPDLGCDMKTRIIELEAELRKAQQYRFGVYRKIEGKTGVGKLYQFLMLARHHTDGHEVVVYIPLRVEPEWAGTIRPCFLEGEEFKRKFQFVGEGLPIPTERQ